LFSIKCRNSAKLSKIENNFQFCGVKTKEKVSGTSVRKNNMKEDSLPLVRSKIRNLP
jgi:hypothetical protein